ncbi:ATP-binding protein [Bosea sp. (in: a-proteobacteria)]|uniref:ATP-binding protein n=1 Tax=Bosea sp. (in: a-proteobacteria) TaxID=1871050 RepID=UPI00260BBF2E|nr:ATP-binding protein [Bosea sp. (in: a-proteobacteria)]MCO5093269.1 ATP-binding protein [Bosea sp. (in: a-proteobacteria)]
MTTAIEIGTTKTGEPGLIDLAELLATRLLVQGNSGSGKSHLLRRLLEQSAPLVQQAIIDPEGDFVSLSDEFGHVVVDATCGEAELQRVALRVRQHRVSVVLNLENLEADEQLRAAAAFLGGLFDVDRSLWFPMLIVVDEAQLFAPVMAGEASDEARRLSLGAMTNLMCRGRKRGLAGVIATQRLAKLAKNVAAEASNFLMGRTFLDIDMARAADLLGMDRRQAEMFRDLARGEFVALGPALSKRPLPLRIGPASSVDRGGAPGLMPLPEQAPEEAGKLIFTPGEDEPAPMARSARPAARPRPEPGDVLRRIESYRPAPLPEPEPEIALEPAEREAIMVAVLRELMADPEARSRQVAVLYQDFTVRCRMRRLGRVDLSLEEFRRRLAVARAGVSDAIAESEGWRAAVAASATLPEDLQGLFLYIARTAIEGRPCPGDAELARVYGSHSPSRARRLIGYIEERGLIVVHVDFRGQRTLALPSLGVETAPGLAQPRTAGMPRSARG